MNWLGCIFMAFFIGLGAWICWEIYKLQLDRYETIHRNQQASLKRFHKMRARDRNEREHTAWWKSLGIGR